MSCTSEQQRQRQDYLKRRRKLKAGLTFACSVTVTLIGVILAEILFCMSLPDLSIETHVGVLGSVGMVSLICSFFINRIQRRATRALLDLPYVAPVTADSLPAEEVLVRAAKEPLLPAATLLRAAASEQTTAQELLRAAQEGKQHEAVEALTD